MTQLTQEDSIVAIYDAHTGAESALKALQAAGIDMKKLSIVGKDFHTEEHALGFYTSGDRMKFWGARGAFWGSLWGMLFGGAFLFIPGVGPLVVMGPFVAWIVGALEGATLGGVAGILAASLTSAGFTKDSALKYEVEVKAGKYLVLAHGTADMIEQARAILGNTGASQVAVHQTKRDGILNLLSDEEVARVSTAETAAHLLDGDEYIDLGQLEQGVRRAVGPATPMGRVLPRKAVQENTWSEIVTRLGAPPTSTGQPTSKSG
jgi:hypothetical protein